MTRREKRSSLTPGKREAGEDHEQVRLVSSSDTPVTCVKMNHLSPPCAKINQANNLDPFDKESFQKEVPLNSKDVYAHCILHATDSSCKESRSVKRARFKCTPLAWFLSIFPVFSWLPHYNWKEDLTYDLVAGTTICVMHIPQGMAYSLLGNMQPIMGLYMAFFPVIVYAFMGTSRSISIGTFAVTMLMTGKVATERMVYYASLNINSIENNGSESTEVFLEDGDDIIVGSPYTVEQIATAISLVVGLWQLLMGSLRLGKLSVLLSAELVSGFTTGAAVHVLTSQIRSLLGLALPRRHGMFKIPLTYVDIFYGIGNANVTAVIFSTVTVSTLILFNEVLKPIAGRKIPLPIPIELITIVVGTLIAKFWITPQIYGFPVVNHIPTGLPPPSLPPMAVVPDVIIDGLIIAIVAYTITISMAKIFAAKHDYVVGPNQELIANGASNIVGSFFMCAPVSASLSRSLIQDQVGGKTQLASLFSCGLLLGVLLWIGPFFETLPHCVLSSIIVVALKGMFLQIYDFFEAFKESPLNAFVWFAAFVSTVLLDVEYGLFVGLLFSIFVLVWKSNTSKISVLGIYEGSDIYVDIKMPEAKEISGIKILKYTGSLNFATVELFIAKLKKILPSNPTKKKMKGVSNLEGVIISTVSTQKIDEEMASFESNFCDFRPEMFHSESTISWIILDMASTSSIDPAGVKALKSLCKSYLKRDIQILFVGCGPSLLEVMQRCELMKQEGVGHFFLTVSDAVRHACFEAEFGHTRIHPKKLPNIPDNQNPEFTWTTNGSLSYPDLSTSSEYEQPDEND